MCGIVGYIGDKKAIPLLIDSLKKLEYRGYDSAGIAVLEKDDVFITRAEGKLKCLVETLGDHVPESTIGIGHTRWATHGKPCVANAHPHRMGRVVLVHNGIVENYHPLKKEFEAKGEKFVSETDTEIICHLINDALNTQKDFLSAINAALKRLEGTYGLAILDVEDPSKIYAAKKGSPLVLGLGENENFIASDIPALLAHTKKVIFLEDGELVTIDKKEVAIFDRDLKKIQKEIKVIEWSAEMAEKGGYKYFMEKEIYEQPRSLEDTLRGRILKGPLDLSLPELDSIFEKKKISDINRFYIVACGTSWHAAMAGKYYIEAIAKVPVNVDTASEFRYREPFLDANSLLLVISQSGETADTLACIQDAKKRGALVVAICNVMESSIPRASDATLYTNAGPEIGVASTKAFTTQLTLLLMTALYLGRLNGVRDLAYIQNAVQYLTRLPHLMTDLLKCAPQIKLIAEKYVQARDFYYIARGVHYPVALEGALKLKEISYIHAEGYAAGEMKHGPIALLEAGTPVVALAPQDRVCDKMISNIEETCARGASIIAIATEGDTRFLDKCAYLITVPKTVWYITPILVSLPLQLLAYFIADLKGCDVDQPRNLAKSVTVE